MHNFVGLGVAVVDRTEETALKVVEEIKTLCGAKAGRCVLVSLGELSLAKDQEYHIDVRP